MVSVHVVADYFITLQDLDAGDSITHLKLQKLVYYAESWYRVFTGQSIFEEEIQAWMHGPVVPVLFDRFRDKGFQAITYEDIITEPSKELTKEQTDILNEVYDTYGPLTARQLEDMTHDETPWQEAYNHQELYHKTPISRDTMDSFYRNQLREGN